MLQTTWTMLFCNLRFSQFVAVAVLLIVAGCETVEASKMANPAAGMAGVGGAAASPSRGGYGGTGNRPGGGNVAGRPSKQSGYTGAAATLKVAGKPKLTVFEKASRGLPLD